VCVCVCAAFVCCPCFAVLCGLHRFNDKFTNKSLVHEAHPELPGSHHTEIEPTPYPASHDHLFPPGFPQRFKVWGKVITGKIRTSITPVFCHSFQHPLYSWSIVNELEYQAQRLIDTLCLLSAFISWSYCSILNDKDKRIDSNTKFSFIDQSGLERYLKA
jgi:hypothetical protein